MEIQNKHISRRINQRNIDKILVDSAIKRLKQKLKTNNFKKEYGLNNWYYPVYKENKVHCYIVGRGVLIASVLSNKMIPKGVKI